MEDILKLQECHKRNITFKQAFFSRGMVDESIPLKQLSAKGEFSALVNWSRNQLPKHKKMELRVDMEGVTYQTTLHKNQNRIRVSEIVKKYGPGAIRYDWLPGTDYHSLNLDEIETSIKRADLINDAKMKGQELTQEMILQYEAISSAETTEVMTEDAETSGDKTSSAETTEVMTEDAETSGDKTSSAETTEVITEDIGTSGDMARPRVPQIKLRETEKNCWQVVLTEEERELIDEFLET